MTESEWLASSDPQRMLAYLFPPDDATIGLAKQFRPSSRKLRFFVEAVTGITTWVDCDDLHWPTFAREVVESKHATHHPPAAVQADLLRDIVGNPFRPVVVLPRDLRTVLDAGTWKFRQQDVLLSDWITLQVLSLAQAADEDRSQRECPVCKGEGWLRTVYGLEETETEDACKACHGTGRIAGGSLDPFRLALVADALEEAGCPPRVTCHGCDNESSYRVYCTVCTGHGQAGTLPHPLLAHLRSEGSHTRGCWSLDAILGLE